MAHLHKSVGFFQVLSALRPACYCSCRLNPGSVPLHRESSIKRYLNLQHTHFHSLCKVVAADGNYRTRFFKCADGTIRTRMINVGSVDQKIKQSSPCRLDSNESVPTKKQQSTDSGIEKSSSDVSPQLGEAALDWDYLVDPANTEHIHNSIANRKGVGNIQKVIDLWEKLNSRNIEMDDFSKVQAEEEAATKKELLQAALLIPNKTHPDVPVGDESQARLIEKIGHQREFNFEPASVIKLGEDLDLLRVDNVGLTSGPRTYYFKHELAQLEQALIKYTLNKLLSKGFLLMSVPDLIHSDVIEGCGFPTAGERSQVYRLDLGKHSNVCLAGTAEMSLAGYFMNRNLVITQLPHRVAAVSRCYRAETSDIADEKGIYRVHQFTKVEMFCVTANESGHESENLMLDIMELQKELFSQLGLHFRILDMPTQELGAPAYRKFDIEAWMPEKQMFGEISSTSNCTDYQSRRLHIKYRDAENNLKYAHTVNGTACAVPRMIMAIMENCQNQDGTIEIPAILQPYMGGLTTLIKPKTPPQLKFMKVTKVGRKNI